MKQTKLLVVVALVVLSSMAFGQLMSGAKIVTEVPFDFVVGNRTVPAGEYIVVRATMDGKVLTIRNTDAKISMFAPVLQGEASQAASEYALVFTCYGDQHFLSGIRLQGSKVTYVLPEGGAEAEWLARKVPAKTETLLASLK